MLLIIGIFILPLLLIIGIFILPLLPTQALEGTFACCWANGELFDASDAERTSTTSPPPTSTKLIRASNRLRGALSLLEVSVAMSPG